MIMVLENDSLFAYNNFLIKNKSSQLKFYHISQIIPLFLIVAIRIDNLMILIDDFLKQLFIFIIFICKMKNHSNIELFDNSNSQIILRKFMVYIKSCSSHMNQMQNYKKQLWRHIKQRNLIQIFKQIDKNKKNILNQKSIKNYLLQNIFQQSQYQIIVKQTDLKFFLKKYSPNQHQIDYDDLLRVLIPNQKVAMISIISEAINKNSHNCKRTENQILNRMASLIIGTQINFIGKCHQKFNQIINISLQKGAQLWRLLDYEHINQVRYQNIHKICQQLQIKINIKEWQNFISWQFNNQINHLNRDNFMQSFNKLNDDKKTIKSLKLFQFQQKLIKQQKSIEQSIKKLNIQNIIREKLVKIQKKSLNDYENAIYAKKHLQQSSNIERAQNNLKIETKICQSRNIDKKLKRNNPQYKGQKIIIPKGRSHSLICLNHPFKFKEELQNEESLKRLKRSFSVNTKSNTTKKQISLSSSNLFAKTLLSGKIGYMAPSCLIKSCQIKINKSLQI